KERSVTLTDLGVDKIEHVLKVQNLYAPENILTLHHVTQALRAHKLFKCDVEYVVREDEVLIVDEFTGRILPGRRYSDGLHQAIEAKEGVKIERENQTLASITLQNYFRLYKKLGGMTGTAVTEAAEFYKIYKLNVVVVPTNKPVARRDESDIVFLTRDDKFKAVIDDIEDCHKRGQPVLVGTISIEASEYLSHLLNRSGIPHNVLNAKQHAREAEIVKEAGEQGRVTIATNMAGRGTDIKINDEVREVGGLRIIGTERHESRRIDNQLRGRSGRQGDPGSSKFYISLEDDLMRIFGGERLKKTMERLGMKPGESIEHSMATRSIEKSQERLEKHNFDIRKHLLEYDDVLNQQRMVIYQYRREILDGADHSKELIRTMIADVVEQIFAIYAPREHCDQENWNEIIHSFEKLTGIEQAVFTKNNFGPGNASTLQSRLIEFLTYEYEQFRGVIDADMVDEAEKWILLETVDHAWKMHLLSIDHIKEGIGLRGYGQKNPLIEYKKESFFEFERMIQRITWDIVRRVFKMKPEDVSVASLQQIEAAKEKELASIQVGGDASNPGAATVKREAAKVGRNDNCPCGSGRKFKHCCGA
ncbi:preprotein translocase subunit SecA, partial [Candidatus Dependentiae bacterium]|nr:preprotein translocase subunit SecA [Candidatus Dependentiae bacterium]